MPCSIIASATFSSERKNFFNILNLFRFGTVAAFDGFNYIFNVLLPFILVHGEPSLTFNITFCCAFVNMFFLILQYFYTILLI